MQRPQPTNQERVLGDEEIIVSKTDKTGRITYVNDVFCRIGQYEEDEMVGAPHSIIRHPDMPRAIFHLLWQRISAGHEIFAYVKNLAKSGDHYWVFAHVTPSYGKDGAIDGYHSNRRSVDRRALPAIEALYRDLRGIEASGNDPKQALQNSARHLEKLLADKNIIYDEFIQTVAG